MNKPLYKSCKINKYCRKYKCHNIDSKLLVAKQKNIGHNYNNIFFNALKTACPQNKVEDEIADSNLKKQRKQCEKKALKKIYKDNKLDDLYKKGNECDNLICAKEQKIFNTNLFRQKQIKLKKQQLDIIDKNNFQNEVDKDLIISGD